MRAPNKTLEPASAAAALAAQGQRRWTDRMSHSKDQGAGWRDEGLVPVFLLLLSYAGVLVPKLVWGLMGIVLMLFGALITVAMWHAASRREHAPTPATRLAVWMLKVWAPLALLGRSTVGWLSN